MRRPLVALLALALAAPPAAAESKLERARVHYKAGEAYFAAGRFDEAIREYRESFELSGRPLLLYNIGSAWRRKAETSHAVADQREAVAAYKRYLAAEPDGKVAPAARAYVASLEKEIAAAPPEPAPAPEPAPPPVVVAPAPAPPPAAAPERDRGDPRRVYRIAGLATAGAGVALLATSVVFLLKVQSVNGDLDDLQPGDPWPADRYDSGRAAQRNMFITGGLGVAAIAGGAVLYFVAGKPLPVTPAAGPGAVGVTYRKTF